MKISYLNASVMPFYLSSDVDQVDYMDEKRDEDEEFAVTRALISV